MIKKLFIICIASLFSLVGCASREITEEAMKENIISKGIVFKEDATIDYLNNQSENYKNLFKQEYNKITSSITYNSVEDKFYCACVNVEDYKKLIQKDTEGYQKDYENMLTLALDQRSIDDYIYAYMRNAINTCGTVQKVFELSLSDTKDSFANNTVIVNMVEDCINELYDGSINYRKIETEVEWVKPSEQLILGKGILLCVNCDGVKTNCFLRIDQVLQSEDAQNYVRNLSSINQNLNFEGNLYVITYTIMNLGKESVTFNDKIVSVNGVGNIITFNRKDIAGLESSKKIEPGIETTITNLYVGNNSGGLLWYDEVCNNILGINLNQ